MARWYFLACFIPSFSLVAGQSPRFELRGQKVSLKPDISGPPDSILWKRNGNKVVEFNGQEQEAYGQYENRISLDWHTAELEIADLRFEDGGDYELEVYIKKQFSTSLHKLEVIDRVAKPTISCEMNNGGVSNKSGTLLCSAEPRQPQSLMRFEWRSHGKVQPGTKLTISLGDKYDDEVYSCRVSNPLSEETATFTAKDCYPENDSVLTAVLVSIAVFSLSLLLMGLGIICCKQHNKACFAKSHNPENPRRPGATRGSDENTADERRGLIDRTPTIPSNQRLIQGRVQNMIKQFENFRGETPAGSQRNKDKNERRPLDLKHPANNNKDDADEDQLRSAETEVTQSENTPEPVVVLSESAKETSDGDNKRPPLDITVTPPTPQPLDHVGGSDTIKDQETAEDDEKRSPIETTPTPPTPQPRNHVGDAVKEKNKDENEETGSPPHTPCSESRSSLDPSNPASNDKGDADADQLSEPAGTEVPHHEKENESKPADVSANTMSDLEPSSASVRQDFQKDEEGKFPPANVVTPVPKPHSQLPQNSPNTAPEVTAGGQMEDANSDQVNGETDTSGVGETHESGSSSEDGQLSPVSEHRDSETTQHDQDPNMSQSETHTSENNQQEINKPVPAAEEESGSEGNSEEPDLYSASSLQPQSSTPTKPDNRSNDTFQESPDAEHGEPGQQGEGKTTKESDECSESEDDTGEDKK